MRSRRMAIGAAAVASLMQNVLGQRPKDSFGVSEGMVSWVVGKTMLAAGVGGPGEPASMDIPRRNVT